jgi:5-methylcytosine-specific restriction endonuclease McrA
VLRRDGYICQLNIENVCVSLGNPLPATELECDHIIEVSDGGSDLAENLRCVCRPCHRRVTAIAAGTSSAQQFLEPRAPRPRRKPAPAKQPMQVPRTIFTHP